MRDRLTENETPKTSTATDPFALAGVLVNPCPGSSFCPRLPAAGGYFTPPGIFRVLEHIATKFRPLSACFRGQTF